MQEGGEAMIHSKRIEWAERAWKELRREFLPTMPERAAITIGFPSRRGRKGGNHTIGECCYRFKSGEGEQHLVSLHPELLAGKPERLLDVLLHEAIHASLPVGSGHKAKFRAAMREVGLEGKPTATVAGEGLTKRLNALVAKLGPLPAATLALSEDAPILMFPWVLAGVGMVLAWKLTLAGLVWLGLL